MTNKAPFFWPAPHPHPIENTLGRRTKKNDEGQRTRLVRHLWWFSSIFRIFCKYFPNKTACSLKLKLKILVILFISSSQHNLRFLWALSPKSPCKKAKQWSERTATENGKYSTVETCTHTHMLHEYTIHTNIFPTTSNICRDFFFSFCFFLITVTHGRDVQRKQYVM